MKQFCNNKGHFNVMRDFPYKGKIINIGLDIDSKDIVQDFTYSGEKEQCLEDIAHQVVGKKLEELDEIDFYREESLFPFAEMALYALINDYRGTNISIDKLKRARADELICRCFGVYLNEILELKDKEGKLSLKTVTDTLMAGAGCGSCVEDIEEFLDLDEQLLLQTTGLSEVQLLYKITQIVTGLCRKYNVDLKKEQILGLQGHYIVIDNSDINPELHFKIQENLQKDIAPYIRVKLS